MAKQKEIPLGDQITTSKAATILRVSSGMVHKWKKTGLLTSYNGVLDKKEVEELARRVMTGSTRTYNKMHFIIVKSGEAYMWNDSRLVKKLRRLQNAKPHK